MMEIIDKVFETRDDPDQLQVTRAQQKKLALIHPATLSELSDENGPVIWVLLVPTTTEIMNDFLSGRIPEKAIVEKTRPHDSYDCIYLCSATTLPEYRGKGKTKALCLEAIRSISNDHPIRNLFVWPFTTEGDQLAAAVARETDLTLFSKKQ
jgi:hypothetical protein